MNRLPFSKQVAVISALVEGNSIRATSRMTGVAKGTILSLLEDVGTACAEFHKVYGAAPHEEARRYSPATYVGATAATIVGNPDPKHISTSYVERQNLTMRMGMRRFTRLTNAFSKKVENHAYQVALHFMHYSFARIHKTLRVTPAMEAGVSDHVWSLEEISDLAK
ncbi:MAG TPA: hypothetical protein VG204_02070 [Terriglobia bacterium]|nr:hypothetical protein [Terriglobia bacterium]